MRACVSESVRRCGGMKGSESRGACMIEGAPEDPAFG